MSMSMNTSDLKYKEKYIKYKTKYLNLMKQLNITNVKGGGLITAKNYFIQKIYNHCDEMYTLFQKDVFLKKQIELENLPEKEYVLELKQQLTEQNRILDEKLGRIGEIIKNNEKRIKENNKKIKENNGKIHNLTTNKNLKINENLESNENLKTYRQNIINAQHEIMNAQRENNDIICYENINEIKNEIKRIEEMKFKPFENIFNTIINGINEINFDYFCKMYMEGKLGVPNSLENKERFNDCVNNYNLLKNNKKFFEDNNINLVELTNINSLTALENYIRDNNELIKKFELNQEEKIKRSNEEKKIKKLGERDVVIELETDKVFIYIPTSINGSKYYGRGTKWCTAASDDNKFIAYKQRGNLYIIQSKTNIYDKYQIHFEESEYMNPQDVNVSIQYIKDHFKDQKLNTWFDCAALVNNGSKELYYSDILKCNGVCKRNMFNNKEILIYDIDEMPDILLKLTNAKIKIVMFGMAFNKPIDVFLWYFSKIEKISFHNNYKYLDETILGLKNLKELSVHMNNYKKIWTLILNEKESKLVISRYVENAFHSEFLSKIENLYKVINYSNDICTDMIITLPNLLEFEIMQNVSNIHELNKFVNLNEIIFGKDFTTIIDWSLFELPNLRTITFDNPRITINENILSLQRLHLFR